MVFTFDLSVIVVVIIAVVSFIIGIGVGIDHQRHEMTIPRSSCPRCGAILRWRDQ